MENKAAVTVVVKGDEAARDPSTRNVLTTSITAKTTTTITTTTTTKSKESHGRRQRQKTDVSP